MLLPSFIFCTFLESLQYPKTQVSSQSRLRICWPHGCNTTLWSHESSAAGGDCKPEILKRINICNEFMNSKRIIKGACHACLSNASFQKRRRSSWYFNYISVSGEWQWRGGRNSCEVPLTWTFLFKLLHLLHFPFFFHKALGLKLQEAMNRTRGREPIHSICSLQDTAEGENSSTPGRDIRMLGRCDSRSDKTSDPENSST